MNHVQNAKPQKVGLGYGEKMTGIQKDIQNAMVGQINGIYGGIKNVVYYKNTLTKQEINLINTV